MRRVASSDKIVGGIIINKYKQNDKNTKGYKNESNIGKRLSKVRKWYKRQPRQIFLIVVFIREKIFNDRKIPKRIQSRVNDDITGTVKDILIDITVNCLKVEMVSAVIEAMLSLSISSTSEVGPLEIMFHAYKIISSLNHHHG